MKIQDCYRESTVPAILVLLLLICTPVFSQQSDSLKLYRIEMKDGNIFTGRIMSSDDRMIILKTESLGEIKISRNDIRTQNEVSEVQKHDKEYWLPNSQSSRYFWMPNGYGLQKGTSNYQNVWVLFNQVSVGVTDNFSIGAGILPVFLLGGDVFPLWIVPKFSIPVVKEKLNIGAGALLGTVLGGRGSNSFGIVFCTATFGSRDKNANLGLGWGFNNRMNRSPIINASFMIRVSRGGYIISENYLYAPSGVVLISLGGRSIVRNVSMDYSLWFPAYNSGSFLAIPVLGIAAPLGAKRTK